MRARRRFRLSPSPPRRHPPFRFAGIAVLKLESNAIAALPHALPDGAAITHPVSVFRFPPSFPHLPIPLLPARHPPRTPSSAGMVSLTQGNSASEIIPVSLLHTTAQPAASVWLFPGHRFLPRASATHPLFLLHIRLPLSLFPFVETESLNRGRNVRSVLFALRMPSVTVRVSA